MRHGRATVLALSGVVAVGAFAGCGDDDDDPPRAASGTTATTAGSGPATARAEVEIKDFKYLPASVTIEAGGSVTWTNEDTAPHNSENSQVEAAPAKFTTRTPLDRGQSDTVSFSKPGTYTYYCVYHRFMEADVIVK